MPRKQSKKALPILQHETQWKRNLENPKRLFSQVPLRVLIKQQQVSYLVTMSNMVAIHFKYYVLEKFIYTSKNFL